MPTSPTTSTTPTSLSVESPPERAQPLRARLRFLSPSAIAVTLALVAPLIAGATLAIVASSRSPLESAAEVAALVGVVESAERTDDVQVAVAVVFAPTPSIAVSTSGTVTAVSFSVGDEIATGTRLVAVDDRDVVAYTSDAPLYRDLARGATGRDVSTAQTLLAELGFDPGAVNATVGSATERAIIAFNKDHGYGSRNTVLSLGSLSWVGTTPVTVAEAKVVLGASVAPGSVLFTGLSLPTAIVVTETPGVARGVPLQLVLGDITAAYERGSGLITDADAVAAVAGVIGTATDRLATLRRVEPLVVGTVPAASIVTDSNGVSCMFSGVEGQPIAVEPLGGSLGTVDLTADLIGRSVLFNPRDVRSDLRCAVD